MMIGSLGGEELLVFAAAELEATFVVSFPEERKREIRNTEVIVTS